MRAMNSDIGRIVPSALVLISIIGLAGCASQSARLAQPTVRSTAVTAPADLQLTCASEAATRLGADSTKVLPISSVATGAGVYRVDLNVEGKQAVCTIDNDGVVQSVEAVG